MNHISKPHLVDLLRIFDRRKYFVPRIRYASVRSKPELLKDLEHFFSTRLTKESVLFIPKATVPGNVPEIRYRLKDRKYYFDGDLVEPPSRYNQKPSFQIRYEPVTLYFGQPPSLSPPASPLSTCTAAASSSESQELDTDGLQGY